MMTVLSTTEAARSAQAALERAKGTRKRGRRKKPAMQIGDMVVAIKGFYAVDEDIPQKFLSPMFRLDADLGEVRIALTKGMQLECVAFKSDSNGEDPQPKPILENSDGVRFRVSDTALKTIFRVVRKADAEPEVDETEPTSDTKEMTTAAVLSAEIVRDLELRDELKEELKRVDERIARKEREALNLLVTPDE